MSRSALTSIVEANLGFLNLLFGRRHILAMTHSWQRILSPQRFVAVVDRSMRYLFGWDTREIDPARKLTLYRHIFSLSSVKLVKHWMQVMYRCVGVALFPETPLPGPRSPSPLTPLPPRSGRFQHFDDTPEPSLPQAAFASIRMLLGGPRGAASSARATKQATASWTEMVVTPGRHPLSALDKRGTARGRGAELEVNPEPEPAQSGGAGAAPLPGPVTRLRAKPRRRTEEGVEEERVPSPTGPKGGMFQSVAPRYDLGAIRSPVTLVYGDRDGLMNVGPMAQRLRRARVFRIDGYEHLDLIWARDAGCVGFPTPTLTPTRRARPTLVPAPQPHGVPAGGEHVAGGGGRRRLAARAAAASDGPQAAVVGRGRGRGRGNGVAALAAALHAARHGRGRWHGVAGGGRRGAFRSLLHWAGGHRASRVAPQRRSRLRNFPHPLRLRGHGHKPAAGAGNWPPLPLAPVFRYGGRAQGRGW